MGGLRSVLKSFGGAAAAPAAQPYAGKKWAALGTSITALNPNGYVGPLASLLGATLVNLAWVSELHADFGGRLVVRLRDDRRTELVVSRDRVRGLKERLGVT